MPVPQILLRALGLVVIYAVLSPLTGGDRYNHLWITFILFLASTRLLNTRRWPLVLPAFMVVGLLNALVAIAARRWMPFDGPQTVGGIFLHSLGFSLTYGLLLTWLGRRDARRRSRASLQRT